MAWVFGVAILLSSCLLFLVQPICGKMLLPAVGGTPLAWNTCLAFFQTGLLVGYAYAHYTPRWLGSIWQAIIHICLLVAAYFTLPIDIPAEMADSWPPVLWLLAALTISAGLPFTLLAANAPLVQRWFVERYPTRDPYFLFAASNIGSFVGLVLFPAMLEPLWPLPEQSRIWQFGFLVLTGLLSFCVPMRKSQMPSARSSVAPSLPPKLAERARWVVLALIPSSLLVSVSNHVTTEVAPIPLFWLIPLGVYLLTFVIAFGGRWESMQWVFVRWLPIVVTTLVFVMLSEAADPMPLVLGLHMFGFFWLAMTCHGELSRTRPAPDHLTAFYLCLALGGAIGGTLSAILAPLVFRGFYEYPLMVVLACIFGVSGAIRTDRYDWLFAVAIGALAAAFILVLQSSLFPSPASVAIMFGLPLILCFAAQQRRIRFALGVGAVFLASSLYHGIYGEAVLQERGYFGIHRVTIKGHFRRLVHGNTVHGQESLKLDELGKPLTYYSERGSVGDIFRALRGDRRLDRVGIVGLGTGSIAAYSKSGQEWTYFEIDPIVKRIAEDRSLFTYLHSAKGSVRVELGDARLRLRQSEQKFGLLIIDAFGSDAIPVHLLTREALEIYFDHLAPNGIVAFHITNRYVDLEPVLANLAADRLPACVASIRRHGTSKDEESDGIFSSDWLVLARREQDLGSLPKMGWSPATPQPRMGVWTDGFSNLLPILRWRD